jgi:glycosyltransferase involved in cell wall biosynthesis
MKILYATYRHAPLAREVEIGADYLFLNSMQANGLDVRVIGPFTASPNLIERMVKRFYKSISSRNYLKYDISNTIRASHAVNREARKWRPDLIFSLYPPPLAFYNGNIPCVFRTDATFIGSYLQFPEFQPYGKAALKLNIWLESKVIQKCALIITHSDWARQSLLKDYHIDPQKIAMYPNPAALPTGWIPKTVDFTNEKKLEGPLRLLFIGRDPIRKGLDIALEITAGLNRAGIPATLSVCGLDGAKSENVTYIGNLSKTDEVQRTLYLALLRSAHLLLHPAHFDPSPRVTSEAAAFGTPTITNDSGGLATSVKHGISGIVLPRNSPPEPYVQVIRELVNQPEKYYALCQSTRQRYEKELSSDVAGKQLMQIFESVVSKSR